MILEVKNLVKHFGSFVAVDHLNLQIREGICFGLLGPNGAGKTTTVEIIEGIVPKTSGEIFFRGEPVSKKFQEHIGIQFQSTALQDRLTVKEVLQLFRRFYKKSIPLDELIHWCSLEELLDRDSNHLSGGQRQRLLLALSLINDPDLIFLDEPTTGLDPNARREFWRLIGTIKSRKKTVVLTTHYMEEAYELCDEIAIMDRGKIIAEGPPDTLLSQYFQGLSIRLPSAALGNSNVLKTLTERGLGKVRQLEDWVEIQTEKVNETLHELIEHKISLAAIQVRSRNLEDLFLELTQKKGTHAD